MNITPNVATPFPKIDRFDMNLAGDNDGQLISSFLEYSYRQLQGSTEQADRFCIVITLGVLAHLDSNESLLERPAMKQLIRTMLKKLDAISKEK